MVETGNKISGYEAWPDGQRANPSRVLKKDERREMKRIIIYHNAVSASN